jgi:NADH dehydrogenase FAD-containing subunit
MTSIDRPRVVILGGGFGGLSAARALARVAVDVTLIDRHNYHLFQPLLYQVATAALAPNTIAAPIRAILRAQHNATVLMETVTGIDTAGRAVLIGEQRVAYDFLIVATGAHHSYFGHDEWENSHLASRRSSMRWPFASRSFRRSRPRKFATIRVNATGCSTSF